MLDTIKWGNMLSRDGSYSRRGDRTRRRERIRKALLLAGLVGAVGLLGAERENVATAAPAMDGENEVTQVYAELASVKDELDIVLARLDRADAIMLFSTRYRIAADLAADIYDIAVAEGLEPDLGFRVIRAESEFRERATSPVGAVGLAQVMPSTARYLKPGITTEELYDRTTNLQIGFRYLRGLIREYNGDVKLALLAYNRGPVTVNNARAAGIDPRNGYELVVLRGYTGAGVLD